MSATFANKKRNKIRRLEHELMHNRTVWSSDRVSSYEQKIRDLKAKYSDILVYPTAQARKIAHSQSQLSHAKNELIKARQMHGLLLGIEAVGGSYAGLDYQPVNGSLQTDLRFAEQHVRDSIEVCKIRKQALREVVYQVDMNFLNLMSHMN